MKKYIIIALLLVASAVAQNSFPDAPSAAQTKQGNPYIAPLRSPSFYVGVGVFAASEGYDIHSTKVCEHTKPPQCAEAYPGHDRYTYALPLIGFVAAGTYGCELIFYQHKWWRRFTCPAIGIGMSIVHWKDGSTIYKNDLNSASLTVAAAGAYKGGGKLSEEATAALASNRGAVSLLHQNRCK